MKPPESGEITRLLAEISAGDAGAEERLLPLVYAELRRMAERQMAREGKGHTLQPTALVHEAYLRLGGPEGLAFDNRAHFFTAAAEAMRRILVESARRRSRLKRGGDRVRVELDGDELATPADDAHELLVLNDLIGRLERHDERVGTVVKLRHFVGLSVSEVADALGSSERTVHRQWNVGRAWLKRELQSEASV